jgi:plasmid stabilization system protein ParE
VVVRFLEIAQFELDEAIEYYNSEKTGLGDEFLLEALDAINRIQEFPEAWQVFSKSSRRCLMRRFPYGVVFQILQNEVLILAVAHLHRDPDCWKDRME